MSKSAPTQTKVATKRKPPGRSEKTMKAGRPRPATRSDDAHAFIPDPSEGGKPPSEDLAEILGEDFVRAATSGNEALQDDLDSTLPEELGGPFVMTGAREELADDVDDSNPAGAEPEAFPRTNAGLVQPSPEDLLDRAPKRS